MCSGAMYLGKMMLVMIPTPGKLRYMSDHGGNQTYDLWNAKPMLCPLSYAVRSVRVCDISKLSLVLRGQRYLKCNHDFLVPKCQIHSNQPERVAYLAEHWASIPKVVVSIPNLVRVS